MPLNMNHSLDGSHEEVKTEEFMDVDTPQVDDGLFLELQNAVRYGFISHVERILKKRADFVNNFDNEGYTLAHWASKKEDASILKLLYEHGADLSARTTCEAKMLPIHWAASEGRIQALQFLLEHRQDINIHDANGCSPLIVATQHNQTGAIIFLIKNHADITQRDNNGDSALHWAAYKGLIEATALLSNYLPQEINRDDVFGQTPVHLAALQGHSECLDYLITECRGDVSKRDKHGMTPLDLSVKKDMVKTEWILRQHSSRDIFSLIKGLGFQKLKSVKYWRFIICGTTDKEAGAWFWRIVFLSNLIGSILVIAFAVDVHLSDLYYLHQISATLVLLWWIFFLLCLFKSPGIVVDNTSENGRFSYETSLNIIAKLQVADSAEDESPNLCHTCRIRRPLRSKHCKVLKRCVYKFDHFCPFVGNTIGRDNYRYFYGFLWIHMVTGTLWLVTVCHLGLRTKISWNLTLFSIYSLMWMFMIAMLLQYHTFLIRTNLTTNENINVAKYSYLLDDQHDFKNPFDKGSSIANIYDAIFPSNKSFYTKKDLLYNR